MREGVEVAEDLTADDFVAGLFAALVKRNVPTVSMREDRFFSAIQESFDRLESLVNNASDVELDFEVFLDPLYRDSAVIREALSAAVQRTLVSLDNPEYLTIRMKFGRREADVLLDHNPGRAEWFDEVADTFLRAQDPHLQSA